jgi:hypothetical protein
LRIACLVSTALHMSDIKVAAATRTFSRGHILFGLIASGISEHDHVLLSSKTINDFRSLAKDHKVMMHY